MPLEQLQLYSPNGLAILEHLKQSQILDGQNHCFLQRIDHLNDFLACKSMYVCLQMEYSMGVSAFSLADVSETIESHDVALDSWSLATHHRLVGFKIEITFFLTFFLGDG